MNTGAKIGIGILVATGVGAGIYFGFIRKDSQGKTWAQRLMSPSEPPVQTDPTIQPVVDTVAPPPRPSAPSSNESFPMKKGMRGPNVRMLQTALINKFSIGIQGGADGAFGSRTEAALALAGYSTPVSESDFNDILAGKRKGSSTPSPVTPMASGSSVYVSKNGVALYSYPNTGSQYIVKDPAAPNSVAQFNLSVTKLGTYVEPAGSGFSKITVNKPYGKNLTGDYFVRTQDIKSTPY